LPATLLPPPLGEYPSQNLATIASLELLFLIGSPRFHPTASTHLASFGPLSVPPLARLWLRLGPSQDS
jgi:hypothetical protein